MNTPSNKKSLLITFVTRHDVPKKQLLITIVTQPITLIPKHDQSNGRTTPDLKKGY